MRSRTYKVNPETYSRYPDYVDEPQENLKQRCNTTSMLSGLRPFSHLPLHERMRNSTRITPQKKSGGSIPISHLNLRLQNRYAVNKLNPSVCF